MANKAKKIGRNGGWYLFGDGMTAWFYGLSAAEKRIEERNHRGIVYYNADLEAFNRACDRMATMARQMIKK